MPRPSQSVSARAPVPDPRLLRTKLYVPRAHPDRVPRPRLVNMLNQGSQGKLTVVSAPPGSGKTTLLSTWIADTQPAVTWLSLDPGDNDPRRFWAYCVAALQVLEPGLGLASLAMLTSPQPPPLESALTELLNALATVPRDLSLVLDDYHEIDNAAIHAGVTFLLDNLPPQMHVIIASRADPPLPLARWRARRELLELGRDDLRFTPDEAAAFMNSVMGLNLTVNDLAELDTLTEGWIAGLQLAALSMQGLSDRGAFIRSFAGSHRHVFDYLAQEVLNRQPEDVQRFLLQTGILDRLSGPLCDAVTERPGSQAVLERLEQANLFLVPLDQQRRWYRYHHLFAEFLRARLVQDTEPARVAALQHRASVWCQRNGLAAQAVDYALAGRAYERVAALLKVTAGLMFESEEIFTILHWLDALPRDLVRADPVLGMINVWALLATSQLDRVEPHLGEIEEALGVAADGSPASRARGPEIRGALAEILSVRANLAFHRQDIAEVLTLCSLADEYLTDDVTQGLFHERQLFQGVIAFDAALALELAGNVPAATSAFGKTLALTLGTNFPLYQIAGGHLARLHLVQGRLTRAEDVYTRVLVASEGHWSPLSGMLHVGLGSIAYQRNDLERADAALRQGVELGRKWNNWETLLPGYIGLAELATARNDFDRARALLDEAAARGVQAHVAYGNSLIDAFRARLSMRQGDLGTAGRWVNRCGDTFESAIPYLREPEAILFARVLIALGHAERSGRLAERLETAAREGQRLGRVVEILVVRALALLSQGEDKAAVAALAGALELAEPEGYVRVFVDEGEPVRDLLARTRAGQLRRLAAYVDRLLAAFPAGVPSIAGRAQARYPAAATLAEPLSEREIEVLRLVAAGLTNPEIAERLVLSLNTIKTHVKNIHSKLGARNRVEAIARARELGLL